MARPRQSHDFGIDHTYILDHVTNHSCHLCFACCNFWMLQHSQELNSNKLRLRHVPYDPEEDIKAVAINILNSFLIAPLNAGDIINVRRAVCYDGTTKPKDIVVTFVTKEVCHAVNSRRDFIKQSQFNHVKILDELIPQRVFIFLRAVKIFGASNVDTLNGCIRARRTNGVELIIYTRQQIEAISTSMRRFRQKCNKSTPV